MTAKDVSMGSINKSQSFLSTVFIAIVVILTILVLAGSIFYFALWRVPVRKTEMENVRKQAEARIDREQSIPDDKNGWIPLNKAAEKIKNNVKDNKGELVDFYLFEGKGVTPENRYLLKRYINANLEPLELVDDAYKRDKIVIPMNYRKGGDEILPEISVNIGSIVKLLLLMGDEEAKKKSCKKAAEYYMKALYIEEGFLSRANFIFLTMGDEKRKLIMEHIVPFILNSKCKEEVYKDITNRLVRTERNSPKFRLFLENDWVEGYYFYVKKTRISKVPLTKTPFWKEMHFQREYSIVKDRMLNILDIDSLDYSSALKLIASQKQNAPMLAENLNLYFDDFYNVYKGYARSRTYNRGLLVVSALKWYKTKTGKYPDNLSQLVPNYLPEIPKDYYSKDRKFIYKKDGDKILLYSIGDDLNDDGGKIVSKWEGEKGDVVFVDKN